MATVQLLLADEANREALASLVGERHETLTDETLRDADVYVVGDAVFARYRERLLERKRDLDPVFCPVVLVRRERSPVDVTLPDIDDADRPLIVNEVVRAPVDRQAFFRTLSNLLVRRSQTEELAGDLRARNAELRRFENAVENAGLAIFVTDPEGTIEYANPAFEQMTGYTSEEAVGRNPRILNSGEQDDGFYDDLWETNQGRRHLDRRDSQRAQIRRAVHRRPDHLADPGRRRDTRVRRHPGGDNGPAAAGTTASGVSPHTPPQPPQQRDDNRRARRRVTGLTRRR